MTANNLSFAIKKIVLFKVAGIFVIFITIFFHAAPTAQAATYIFTQTDWSGGTSASTIIPPTKPAGINFSRQPALTQHPYQAL